MEIMNSIGTVVQVEENASNVGYIDLSMLPSGTYTIMLHSSKGSFVRKLVKL
jgi:hypothetical protein